MHELLRPASMSESTGAGRRMRAGPGASGPASEGSARDAKASWRRLRKKKSSTFIYELYQEGCGIAVYFWNVRMYLRSPDLEPFHNAKISVV